MDKQKKTSTAKKIMRRIILLIVVVILIIYLLFNTIGLIMSPTDTYVVENGVLNLSENVQAYVIRNEKILQGENYMNGMEKVVAEGKRVARGDAVFRYYVNGEDTIKNEISELDKKITEAQKNETSIYNTDITTLQGKIRALEEKIYESNSIEEIQNYKKEINEYTYKISTIVGELSPSGSYLKDLINQKNSLLNKLTDGAEEVRAEESGTVSYRIDNLEEIFSTADFNYLTSSFLNELNLNTGELIESNDQKGKVITDFYTYLAVIMDSDAAMKAKVGDTVTIKFSSELRKSSEIVHIKDEDEKRVIVFKVNDLPEVLINYRKVSLEVIWWEISGLKVPNSSIIMEDGKSYVEKNRSGHSVKVLVKVLGQNDSYSIVDNYAVQELQDMGYSYDTIKNMYSIKQYDKVNVKNK